MRFLEKKYNTWSPIWIIQRIIVVFKERRFPEIGLFIWLNRGRYRSENKGLNHSPKKIPVPITMMEVRVAGMQNQQNLINTYFNRIYLLNLKHRSDKRLQSVYQLQQMGINAWIVDGINGNEEPHKSEYEKYLSIPLGEPDAHPLEKKYNRKMISSPGAWGVLKSKKLIFQDAIQNNYKRILILQDDLFFIEDFHRKFEEFIRAIDDDWKIVGLGATQHAWLFPGSLFYDDLSITEYDPGKKFYYPLYTDGAFALGYDQSVFPEIIAEIDKMNCSFDSGPVRAIYHKYRKKCYICQPNLIIADVRTSDIRGGRDQAEFSKRMKWNLPEYDLKKYQDDLVSVIMPAYNAGRTIEKSIRSVLLQTYQNLEILVVDDGSTDNTADIVKRIAKDDDRVIFIRNEQNRGCYFVRNDALRQSKGKYIAIQDADDISLKDRIEKQLIPLVSGNAFVTFSLFLRSRCTPEELDLLDQNAMLELAESRRKQVDGKYDYFDKYNVALATSVYRRDLFERYGLFWESRFGSDNEFLERIFFHELGLSFNEDSGNAHSLITKMRQMPGAFQLVEELLYISPQMENSNLSVTYAIQGDERKEFTRVCRDKLKGIGNYQYPEFNNTGRPE
ncbi:MAG: glycosyltransferase [Bacteroidales bacterium]|nr:glycosyltransferase [Bacteroidales bacterium]